jgi:molybdopterin synthase catalytic subunit
VALTTAALPVAEATEWATTPRSGAVVTFLGVVRDHAEGRDGVTGLTYEAYEEVAVRRMHEIAADARRRWPDLERIALLHRTGDLDLSEASVAVVVSSPHRAEAFDAARFAIDTLKETVPIWKREHWAGGADWATSAHDARPVQPSPAPSPLVDAASGVSSGVDRPRRTPAPTVDAAGGVSSGVDRPRRTPAPTVDAAGGVSSGVDRPRRSTPATAER